MNNNLKDNLKKIRKDNNFSQEQLAEELGVSRQAISKWESGAAYPEMDKIIQLCDKFDMNIDDLLHKDIREIKGEEISKSNLNKFIESFFNYITDTINLFSNMNFKSKIKCLLEQIVILIILSILTFIIGTLGSIIVSNLFQLLPYRVYSFIYNLLSSIYVLFAVIVSFVILIHIFKTRYLDYYSKIKNECDEISDLIKEDIDNLETIKDEKYNDKEEKTNKQNRIMFKRNENKIIIRDPKHSEYKFINGLFKIIMLGIKFFTLIGLTFLCFILIGLFASFILSFAVYKTGIFFIGLLLSILSISIIDITIILLLLNFIFNRKNDKKKMIWTFIISLIILGIGCGTTLLGSLKFDIIDDIENNDLLETRTFNLDMNDELFIGSFDNIEYIEEDIDNIRIEYKINKSCKLHYDEIEKYGVHIHGDCSNPMALIRNFIKSINNKKIIAINNEIFDLKVYASKENITLMKENCNKYYNDEINKQNILYEYENEIYNYQNQIQEYDNKINELQNELDEYKNNN